MIKFRVIFQTSRKLVIELENQEAVALTIEKS